MVAEIVVGLLGPIIEVAKCIAAPIKRQFSYLCCFSSNVKILDKEANKLEDVRHDLQRDVDTHIRNAQVIGDQVNTWLSDVGEIQQKKSELDTEIVKASGENCWSVKLRYSASRRAVKTAETMKQKVVERSNITRIALGPLPTSEAAYILERPTCEFESRAKIEEALMMKLKDKNVAIVGICGMGGVGKTTLAEKIKNKLRKENIFGDLVTVVVSQSPNKEKIQGEIAEKLGLEMEERSLSSRVEKLCNRLTGGKRVLLVLDDVWEDLDLNEIGIPCKSGPEGCTILITSRDKSVLTRMDIAEPNILEMEILSKEEAWSLFKEKLGTRADDQIQFPSLAREIADRCNGLPLALASVAGALKVEKKEPAWRSAREKLRSHDPEDLSDVLKKVYIPLKLSYDYLSSSNAQTIFLLCSLYPEDSDIGLQDLTVIARGLRMFDGMENLENVRDRVEYLIGMLKQRYLLLDYPDGDVGYVRMHDVVRDVAIFIAFKAPKEKPLIKCSPKSTWISPFVGGEKIELFKELTFPNLRLLMIQDKDGWNDEDDGDNEDVEDKKDHGDDEESHISDITFERMKDLNVLFVSWKFSWTSLSLSQNLRTLVLYRCKSLETISVGDLWNLEILICRACDAIKEFPSETLKSLKLLEISYCQALEKIGSAGALPCPGKITFPKLESLVLQNLGNLRIFYQGIDSIEFPLLSHVKIEECPKLEGLVSSSGGIHMSNDDHDHSLHLFCKQKVSFGSMMKRLILWGLTNYHDNVVFCPQIPVGSFTLLEEFKIEHQSIKSLFSFSIAQNLKSLKLLMISDGKEMVNVIEEEKGEHSHEIQHITIEFPKLESLVLKKLPNLRAFYQVNASIKFPLLDNLEIYGCNQLKSLGSSSEGLCTSGGDDDHSLHLLCNHKVSFGSFMRRLKLNGRTNCDYIFCPQISIGFFTHLEKLHIWNCANNKILFPFSIAQNLDSLRKLLIKSCYEMEKVIEEAEEECSHDTTLAFPHLEQLTLGDLPSLRTFSKSALGFPKLVNLEILRCPEMGGLNLGSLTTPNLERLEILRITTCERNMEHVFWWSEVENENSGICHSRHVKFPNLRTLELRDLTRLKGIFKGVESIEFPHLTSVSINGCPNLKSVVSATTCSNSGDINNEAVGKLKEQASSIWDQISIGSFTTLEYLDIRGVDVISSLFSSSIARKFINLKKLKIGSCKEMVKVIEGEVEEYSHETTPLFPHLEELSQVKSFCEWKCALELPSLERVDIYNCPKMERFSLGSLTTPKLESIKIDGEPITIAGESNDVLQQQVSFGNSMKHLFLRGLNNLFCLQIPIGTFTHLEELHVWNCGNDKILFPFSISQNLDSLKLLKIWNCNEIEEVIEEAEEGCSHDTTFVFPHLEQLILRALPRLKTFCNAALGFPKLANWRSNVVRKWVGSTWDL